MRIEPNETNTEEPSATDNADDMLAALDQGIEAAETEPTTAAEPAAVEGEEGGAQPPVEGTETGEKPAENAGEEPGAQPPEATADVDQEVKDLGLTGKKSEARFRELSAEVKELAPVREAMKELGLQDVGQTVAALSRVRDADYVIGEVTKAGASPEQFDQTLQYLALVNAGARGDTAALEQGFDMMLKELQVVARALGKELPGIVDPLEGHDDLREEVEGGNMTRKAALEVAQARQQRAIAHSAAERAQHQNDATAKMEEAINTGRTALTDLGNALAAADPARYAALKESLVAKVRQITATHPPHEWRARTAEAYATLPYTPAPVAQPRAPVGHVPMRPQGGRPNVTPATFDSPEAALDAALAGG